MAFKESLSRRNFLSGSALALAAPAFNRIDLPASMVAAAQSTTIIKRKLGKTDIEIPIVSMGVMNADNPAVVQESYKLGIRFFDTARGYQNGNNERMVGNVIKSLGARKDVCIQTKARLPQGMTIKSSTPEQRKNGILEELQKSLDALQMDFVDLFLLHSPSVDEMTDSGIKEALAEMKKLKKARYVGISHHQGMDNVLNVAVKEGIYDAATISCNFTMAQDKALFDAIRNAAKAGFGVIAMKTQATGRGQTGNVNQTAALKWVLRNPEITTAIPGYTNFDHMKEDFSVAYGLDFNDAEKKFLSEKNLQASVQFCQQCENCRPTCPNGVDIPTLMRTHMYAAKYGNFVHARATLDEIAANVGLKNCANCSDCNAKCANYVNISDNIRDLKTMYL